MRRNISIINHHRNARDPLLRVGQDRDEERIVHDGASQDGGRLNEALWGQTNRGDGGGHGSLLGSPSVLR
jgi:hypothetical protein